MHRLMRATRTLAILAGVAIRLPKISYLMDCHAIAEFKIRIPHFKARNDNTRIRTKIVLLTLGIENHII